MNETTTDQPPYPLLITILKISELNKYLYRKYVLNMKKKLIRLTESDLHQIVKESVKTLLKEDYEYDNVEDSDIERFNGNYTEVTVPDYCLPYLVNGDMDIYNDDEVEAMKEFEREWNGKLANGLNIGDVCVPLEEREPSFMPSNDVFGYVGCDCYRFLVPLK